MLLLQFKIVVCLYISFYTYNTHVPSKAIIFLFFYTLGILLPPQSLQSLVAPTHPLDPGVTFLADLVPVLAPTRHSHTHITAIAKIECERQDHLVLTDTSTVRDLDTNAREACRDSDHKKHSKRPTNHPLLLPGAPMRRRGLSV